ncbi:MAG: hypothetical protein WC851_04235 [Candidatus Shapirobacteria bacterium]
MASVTYEKTLEWLHKRQPSTLVEDVTPNIAEVPTTRVTSGPVFEAVMKLRAALKDPEKHPEVTIIYAENS